MKTERIGQGEKLALCRGLRRLYIEQMGSNATSNDDREAEKSHRVFRGGFFRGGFLASALTLLSGAMLAQVVNVLSIPALTRCYSPADFAALAIVAAVISVVMSFATGRYEFALLLCDDLKDRAKVIALSCGLAILTTSLVALVAIGLWVANVSWIPLPFAWVVLTPLLVLACSIASVCNQYQIASGQFRRVALAEFSMVFMVAASQLSLAAWYEANGTLLILGMLLGRLTSMSLVARGVPRFLWQHRHHLKLSGIRKIAREHKKFPTYTTLFELVAAAGNELPAFILRIYFAPQALGYFAVSMRVMEKPVQLVNASVSPVVLRRISQIRDQHQEVNRLLLRMTTLLFLLVLPVVAILFIFPERIFEFAFGKEWSGAGAYAKLLLPMFAVRFATLPCWTGLIGRGKPQWMLVWTATHFVVCGLTMMLFVPSGSAETVVFAYSVGAAFTHLLLLALNMSPPTRTFQAAPA